MAFDASQPKGAGQTDARARLTPPVSGFPPLTSQAAFAKEPPRFCGTGQVAEWLMAADCKSADESLRWFESSPAHQAPRGVQNFAIRIAIPRPLHAYSARG